MIKDYYLKSKVIVVGAGPVGSMLAIILARAGYHVDVFESRPDPRVNQGKSINITLSARAQAALAYIGLAKQVRQFSWPIYQRMIHTLTGEVIEQRHGKGNQALWSISRETLAQLLLNTADQESNTKIHFEQRLTHIDFISGCTSFSSVKTGRSTHKEVDADYIFAADGAFSKVRRLAQETPRFSYSQHYMKQCYVELNIAANKNGSTKLAKNTRHLWPRGDFLLTALPNKDASFTCTLYLNYQGKPSFSSLTTPAAVKLFFQNNFADIMPILENPVKEFLDKIAKPLFLISIDPWVINNKVALIGDAAHAMVPFYGQGLNCSFEDCLVLANLIKHYQGDLAKVLPSYYQQRKNNADAISKLSKEYFVEINNVQHGKDELLSQKIVNNFRLKQPLKWPLVDEIISFYPNVTYVNAREISQQQKAIITEIMKIPHIHLCWQQDFIYQQLKQLAVERLVPLL